MQKTADFIIRFKWLVVILTIVISVFLAPQILKLRVNPDIFEYLPDDDPDAMAFKKIDEKYGGNLIGIIGLEAEDIFDKDVLSHIRMITDSLKYEEGVSYVSSLTDIIDIKDAGGMIEITKLIDEYSIPSGEAELESLREYVMSNEMYRGSLVSEDGTLAIIVVRFESRDDKMQIAENIRQEVKSYGLPENIYFGGLPFMLKDIGNIILQDITYLGSLALIIIALVLFFGFRTLRGIIMPLLTVLIAITWTLGIMGLLGYEITMITNITPVILLAVGSAYTIHVVNRIQIVHEGDSQTSIKKALAYIMVPVAFASITTAIGFVSFIFGSYLTMIKDFGVFTALGVVFSLVLSVSFAPALIAIAGKGHAKKQLKSHSLDRALEKLFYSIHKQPKTYLLVWLFVLLVFVVGIFRIERKFNLADYFKDTYPSRVAELKLKEKFGGTLPVYVNVKGNVQDPEVLKLMRKTADYMDSFGDVSQTQSVADLIEKMNEIMGEGKRIPDEEAKVMNLWFLLEGQEILSQMVSYELDEGLIQGVYANNDRQLMNDFVYEMQAFIDKNQTENCQMELTGFASLYKKLEDSLLESQLKSLAIAIILVLLAVSLVLGSFRKGVFAIIPIAATLIILFGFMGLSSLPLDIATVLVGSVSIGIGIDYAIHMITHFNNDIKHHKDAGLALKNSMVISGRSILINVLSVMFGFSVLLMSDLVPLQRFGLCVSVTMLASGLATLTLLPVFILYFKKWIK